MLRQLTIEHIALIERLELEFNAGLSVITGETGAGKSIVLDSLGLILGERADLGLIRAGSERAMVSGHFTPPAGHPAWDWLQARDLDRDEDGVYLRRVISHKGRGKAYINETPVPVATLGELGNLLVDIHGQHDHQSLVHPRSHLDILDAFGEHLKLAHTVKKHHRTWHEAHKALALLREKGRDASERRAFLSFQLEELETAAVRPGESEALEHRRTRLAHAGRLAEAAHGALQMLSESEYSAISTTGGAANVLEGAVRMDTELEAVAQAIRSAQYELEDAAERVRHYESSLETDPLALQELEERLDTIQRVARKHRREPDELEELANQWREELDTLDSLDEGEATLLSDVAAAEQIYHKEAAKLSKARRRASDTLAREVEKQLKDLYMTGTRFAVSLTPRPPDEIHSRGMEEAEFLVSANPGEPLKPLRQVASGGELARLMLALKTVLADAVTVPTLIFDEVDVGVGGRVAAAIGSKLDRVSAAERQVFSITHLPQVAAYGHRHYRVEKISEKGRTHTQMVYLNDQERIEELARMLAGDTITDSARENAQALIQAAQKP
ncbi:DNA repair protein RecN [Magnetococcus sp. PR-3]|uniref:DNA repair protein RecN n=1 Tax=Magnetococcus sp. PR-3 TaxID=3120355 RepID=UPI002FCDFC90